jgi:hypothetical protein
MVITAYILFLFNDAINCCKENPTSVLLSECECGALKECECGVFVEGECGALWGT